MLTTVVAAAVAFVAALLLDATWFSPAAGQEEPGKPEHGKTRGGDDQ